MTTSNLNENDPRRPIPQELAFELGRSLARLHWHTLNSGIALASDEPRQSCLDEIEALLIKLFPEARGGLPRDVVRRAQKDGGFRHDQWFQEEYCDCVLDACQQHAPDADDVGQDLIALLPDDADEILRALSRTSIEERQFRDWVLLGICLEEGLYPRLNGVNLLTIEQKGNEPSKDAGWRRLAQTQTEKLPFHVFGRASVVAECQPPKHWIIETESLLRRVGSDMETASLQNSSEAPASQRVEWVSSFANDLVNEIRLKHSVTSSSCWNEDLQLTSTLFEADPMATHLRADDRVRADADWLHDEGVDPPETYAFGPLTSTKTKLGFALRRPVDGDVDERQYRYHLKTIANIRSLEIWLRRALLRKIDIFFRDQKEFERVQERLNSSGEGTSTEASGSQRKPAEVALPAVADSR